MDIDMYKYILYLCPRESNPLSSQLKQFRKDYPPQWASFNEAFTYPYHLTMTHFFYDSDAVVELVELMSKQKFETKDLLTYDGPLTKNNVHMLMFHYNQEMIDFLKKVDQIKNIRSNWNYPHLSLSYGTPPEATDEIVEYLCKKLNIVYIDAGWDIVLFKTDLERTYWDEIFKIEL